MYRSILGVVCLLLLLTTGCASMFTVGEESFACKGNAEGGKCGDPMTIYKNKEKIVEEQRKAEKSSEKSEEIEIKTKDDNKTAAVPRWSSVKAPVPVRKAEDVRRVYINSFKDSRGNFIGDMWAFTIVDKGDWLLPDGRRVTTNVE